MLKLLKVLKVIFAGLSLFCFSVGIGVVVVSSGMQSYYKPGNVMPDDVTKEMLSNKKYWADLGEFLPPVLFDLFLVFLMVFLILVVIDLLLKTRKLLHGHERNQYRFLVVDAVVSYLRAYKQKYDHRIKLIKIILGILAAFVVVCLLGIFISSFGVGEVSAQTDDWLIRITAFYLTPLWLFLVVHSFDCLLSRLVKIKVDGDD